MPATHTDFLKMLEDMYEYSKKDPSSIIISSDDPPNLRIGFIVIRNDDAKSFNIQLSDYRASSLISLMPFPPIETPNDRNRFCQKDFLASIIDPKPIELEKID